MPIPDEKSRAWTRPEDYWPPRRQRRSGRSAARRLQPVEADEPSEQKRPLLDLVPYAALMLGLAVLAIAIIALAWPGRYVSPATVPQAPAAIGTAPKGWIDQPEIARS